MATPHMPVANSQKAKYIGRLSTPREVQKELARLYLDARRGALDSGDAYRMSLILGQLAKAMEVTTLADQLDELEDATDLKIRRIS